MEINKAFWREKKVLVTGHTGFKGSWLCMFLHKLGANIHGYALNPPTAPSLYDLARIGELISDTRKDIRDLNSLRSTIEATAPEIIFHLAAQPLVRESYETPLETFTTNVMGTANLLEAIRTTSSVKAVINVTTDKCYENQEWLWGYREIEKLGGHDPYSASKACSEIVTSAYRRSFFSDLRVGIATARAGNVIGGGDFAKDRLLPDCVQSTLAGVEIVIRYPEALRPWQHVIEPIWGYVMLAEKLYTAPEKFSEAFNFGPEDMDAKPVRWIVSKFCEQWPGARFRTESANQPHEAKFLKLDISKARTTLGFTPRWRLDRAIKAIIEWTRVYDNQGDVRAKCLEQIDEYLETQVS